MKIPILDGEFDLAHPDAEEFVWAETCLGHVGVIKQASGSLHQGRWVWCLNVKGFEDDDPHTLDRDHLFDTQTAAIADACNVLTRLRISVLLPKT